MSASKHFIVATAGHVDHGKSALVEALTGIHPDRLPEEKARGITIDLGFASLDIASPSGDTFRIGIVDVPGHEDFVKNMVAGVGAADLALLVVAADDGWMPQTEEHLQVLTYFGVPRAIVALTKADLTTGVEQAADAVRQRLCDTPFAAAPIVPTSVVTGLGLEQLRSSMAQVLAEAPVSRDIGKPRLPVDRVFTLTGIGTVVTGTLLGGQLRRGQQVVVQPSGRTTRVRRMQSHNKDVDTSGPGMRTALNVPDLGADEVRRGDVVTLAGLGQPSRAVNAVIQISERAHRTIKSGARVHLHHGSGHVAANLVLQDGDELAPGGRAIAQLRLDHPACVFEGDRFTIRDWAEQATLAGGMVLDAAADPRQFRTKPWREFLAHRAKSPRDVVAWVASLLTRDTIVRRSVLLVNAGFSQDEVDGAVEQLTASQTVMVAGEMLCLASAWLTLRQRAIDAVDSYHRAYPDRLGVTLTDLRVRLGPMAAASDVFDALVLDLSTRELVREGSLVRRTVHRPALPPAIAATGAALRATLAARPLDPPSRNMLTPDAASVRALRFLVDTGEAIEIGTDLVLAAESVTRARSEVVAVIREKGAATLSDFRDRLGCSRRVLVPLLDYFDRVGLTRRSGDRRTLA